MPTHLNYHIAASPYRHILILLLFLPAALLPAATSQPANLGAKVLAFCRANKGKQVGDGECAALAVLALKAAGASHRGKDDPNDGDYTWGERVFLFEAGSPNPKATGRLSDVKPGDVIQFRNAQFAGRDRKQRNGTYTQTMDHHTAVVVSAAGDGTVFILHQNTGGKREVTDGTLYLYDLKQGWLRVYRPVPAKE